MAAASYPPPALVVAFNAGGQAILAVVALEVEKRSKCTLALGHMAALAGVCLTVAKRALPKACMLGLVENAA
jgi:riboflavin synthase alpha subunit